MAKKRRKRKGLDVMAEEFAASLIYEASGGSIGRGKPQNAGDEKENSVSFRDRRALLDSITKLLSNQKDPSDDDEDGISTYREHLRGGDSGTTSGGTDPDDSTSEA